MIQRGLSFEQPQVIFRRLLAANLVLTIVHPPCICSARARFNDRESDGKVYPKSYDRTISACGDGGSAAPGFASMR